MNPSANIEVPQSTQNVFTLKHIEILSDYQGSFSSFVDCIKPELDKLTVQDTVIVCIDSMFSGRPRRDVFNYNPQLGIEGLQSQFEDKYRNGVEL